MKLDLWDLTRDAFLVLDSDGTIVKVNAALCQLLERDQVALVRRSLQDVFDNVREWASGGHSSSLEGFAAEFRRPAGQRLMLAITALDPSVLRLPNFACFRVEQLHTERRDSFAAEIPVADDPEGSISPKWSLRIKEERTARLDLLDEFALVLLFDDELRLVQANRNALELSGFEWNALRESLLPELFRFDEELWNPSQFERSLFRRGLTQRKKLRDVSMRTLRGSWLALRGAFQALSSEGSETNDGFLFVGVPSERTKSAQGALADELAFRRAVLDSSEFFALTTDRDGLISMVNAYTLKRLGYDRLDLVGHKTPSLFLEGDFAGSQWAPRREEDITTTKRKRRPSVFQDLAVSLETGVSAVREAVMKTRDGESLPVLCSASKVLDQNGRGIGYVLVAQDISEMKRLDRLKSEFVSTVSHELRTPLTSINGALRIMEGHLAGDIPDKVLSLIGMASRNADRLIHLVSDLLDIQKMESGMMKYEISTIELADVVQASIDAMSTYETEKKVIYRVHYPERPTFVLGDARRLEQVLINLLSNAVKFSSEGGTVQVSLKVTGGNARLSVRDYGQGIPEAFHKRIFDKFSQADASDAKEKSGTGLGLSIAKSIVAQHHGDLRFWSDSNLGTEFYFEIPLAEPMHQAKVLPSADSKGATVLVVEDDPDIGDILVESVDELGYCCLLARSIDEATEILESEMVDTITLDLVMPDHHGSVLISRMRARSEWKHIPVIVISGYEPSRTLDSLQLRGRERGRSKAFALGTQDVFAWLSKPIKRASLERTLAQALRAKEKCSLLVIGASAGEAAMLHRLLHNLGRLVEVPSIVKASSLLQKHRFSKCVFVSPSLGDLEIFMLQAKGHMSHLGIVAWYPEDKSAPSELQLESLVPERNAMTPINLQMVKGTGPEASSSLQGFLLDLTQDDEHLMHKKSS